MTCQQNRPWLLKLWTVTVFCQPSDQVYTRLHTGWDTLHHIHIIDTGNIDDLHVLHNTNELCVCKCSHLMALESGQLCCELLELRIVRQHKMHTQNSSYIWWHVHTVITESLVASPLFSCMLLYALLSATLLWTCDDDYIWWHVHLSKMCCVLCM